MRNAESLEKLLKLTTDMLDLATKLDLDALTNIQAERADIVGYIKTLPQDNSSDAQQRLEKILTLEKRISEILQPWHEQMSAFMSVSTTNNK